MIARRATSLKAMFCADRLGAVAIAMQWRRRSRMAQRPAERLHAAQAAADHRGELLDAEPVEQPRLRVDPVLDRHDREVGAVRAALGGRIGIGVHRPGRAEARARVVDADDEEAPGVERLARTDQVVPPAFALRLAGIAARHMVAGVERMAHEHRIAARGVELAVGLVGQLIVTQLARRCAMRAARRRPSAARRQQQATRCRIRGR